jgi:hypothetical protein
LTQFVQAGFGISPPYVINKRLIPGSYYEQKINLSRSNPDEDLTVLVEIDAPEIASWISIDPGVEFLFPKGEKLTEITVKVNVPDNAELKNYKGYIRAKVVPVKAAGGQVSVALGARIDVDLTVGKGEFFDFLVRAINISNVAKKAWPLKYFNKVEITLKVENTGNIKSSPTKVHLDVYDIYEKGILESGDDTSMAKIKPFEEKEITAAFSTKLEPGTYYGIVKVYKEDEISRQEKIIFSVTDAKFTFKDWIVMILGAIGLAILTYVGYWLYKSSEKRGK